jgi:hypothetical protein
VLVGSGGVVTSDVVLLSMETLGWIFVGFIWGVAALQLRNDLKETRRERIELRIDGHLVSVPTAMPKVKLPNTGAKCGWEKRAG